MSDEVLDGAGRVWRLTRDSGESDTDYAARLESFRQAVAEHMTLDERIRRLEEADAQEKLPADGE